MGGLLAAKSAAVLPLFVDYRVVPRMWPRPVSGVTKSTVDQSGRAYPQWRWKMSICVYVSVKVVVLGDASEVGATESVDSSRSEWAWHSIY